jgi:leucyl aminopeptidase
MKISFAERSIPTTGAAVVGVLSGRKLTPGAQALDRKTKGAIMRAVKASRFKGDRGQSLTLMAPAATRLQQIHLVGLGKAKEMNVLHAQALGGRVYAALSGACPVAAIVVDALEGCPIGSSDMAAEIAFGARLRSYRFDKYRTREKKDRKPVLKNIKILCNNVARARRLSAERGKVADGVFMTRDLVSEPSNVIYPETLAAAAKTLEKLGVKVEILGRAQMKKLGMGALLGVAQGSVHEPKLVVMRWNGAAQVKGGAGASPIAFVGKGVTFDSGGISIKPSGGMEDMKWDMAGAAVVIGLMKALAGRKAKADVVGVVGLVENMPSGGAQRPGDIVTSMSGQTIEVFNTDAEGRLVLADALWYCKERFKPRVIVDLATLTGAIIVCLGAEKAGLFANNDELAKRLFDAGGKVGEKLWRLPLDKVYDKMIDGEAADVKNISGGRGAGSITAAQFLQRFVGKTSWAHLDIAGVTWSKKSSAVTPKGGTAFGVRLLNDLMAEHYEAKE